MRSAAFLLALNENYFTYVSIGIGLLALLFGNTTFARTDDLAPAGLGTVGNPYVVPKTESEIQIDAVLDEEAWEHALLMELNYEVQPGENVPPPVRTEVLLVYDNSQLYAAFRCYDPEPSSIRAHLSDRDHIGGDDCVGIVLDTFNDERRCYNLLANPFGVQSDFIEAESGGSISWDGIWDSAGRIYDWGFAVEMAIPFNQLRFQRTDVPQTWSFDAVRTYPRGMYHQIGSFPRDRSNNCYLCQALKIKGFEGVSPGHNLEITPTFTGVRTDERSSFPDGRFEKAHQDFEPGLTAKWGLTPNIMLSGTLNPDFSQVEADAFQLDINRPFALYYPERRPFFTEGADFFSTLKSAIYTRTMRDPAWGLKLTGKEGPNTIGAYVVRDDITNLIFPGSQGSRATSLAIKSTASVLRYKRDIGSRYTLGGFFTDREGSGYFNRMLGFDCDLRITPTDQIQVQLLGSQTAYPDEVSQEFGQPAGDFSDEFIAFEYDHDSRNVYWWLDYDEVGSQFRADLGFIPMVGYRNVEGGLFFTRYADQGKWWSRMCAGTELNFYEDEDGGLLDKGGSLWFLYEGELQSSVYLRAYKFRETYNDAKFDMTYYYAEGGLRPSRNLRFYLGSSFGDRIDYANTRPGERILLNPYVEYNLNKHLLLELGHTFERLWVDEGRLYTANISRLIAVYQFNVRAFFRSIVQHVEYRYDTDHYTFAVDPIYRHFATQHLFSYKINPRTVFFLGYSDGYYGDASVTLSQNERTIFTKISYAWVP